MNKIVLVLILLCGCFLSFDEKINKSQEEEDVILWSKNRKLTWDDFQGLADETKEDNAFPSFLIESDVKLGQDNLDVTVQCSFNKKASWTSSNSNLLLKYFQLRFDIIELNLRKLREKVLKVKISELENGIDDKIIENFYNRLYEVNKKYDNDTKLGQDSDKLNEWEKKVEVELKEFEAFEKSRYTLSR